MIEQRSAIKLLDENPVTETVPWIVGEPSVQDLLADPVVHAVLRRDGLSMRDLMRAIARGRRRLSGTLPVSTAPIPMAPAVETLSSETPATGAA
jgi:hypothetical protein